MYFPNYCNDIHDKLLLQWWLLKERANAWRGGRLERRSSERLGGTYLRQIHRERDMAKRRDKLWLQLTCETHTHTDREVLNYRLSCPIYFKSICLYCERMLLLGVSFISHTCYTLCSYVLLWWCDGCHHLVIRTMRRGYGWRREGRYFCVRGVELPNLLLSFKWLWNLCFLFIHFFYLIVSFCCLVQPQKAQQVNRRWWESMCLPKIIITTTKWRVREGGREGELDKEKCFACKSFNYKLLLNTLPIIEMF